MKRNHGGYVSLAETKKDDPLKHLTLMPNVKKTLRRLKAMGLTIVLISQLPYSKRKAIKRLERITKHFGIHLFFDEIRPSYSSIKKGHADPKDIAILEVLRNRKIPKSQALMVGDVYDHDYLPAKRSGIDCVLIDGFKHTREDVNYRRVRRKISDMSGVLEYLD